MLEEIIVARLSSGDVVVGTEVDSGNIEKAMALELLVNSKVPQQISIRITPILFPMNRRPLPEPILVKDVVYKIKPPPDIIKGYMEATTGITPPTHGEMRRLNIVKP